MTGHCLQVPNTIYRWNNNVSGSFLCFFLFVFLWSPNLDLTFSEKTTAMNDEQCNMPDVDSHKLVATYTIMIPSNTEEQGNTELTCTRSVTLLCVGKFHKQCLHYVVGNE